MVTTILMCCMFLALGFCITLIVKKSVQSPGPRQMQFVMFNKRFVRVISNIEGHLPLRLTKEEKKRKFISKREWDIVPRQKGVRKRLVEWLNIYFILWPFWKLYEYPFKYTLVRHADQVQKGDSKMWSLPDGRQVVERKGTTNFVERTVEYAFVSSNLDAKELGGIVNTLIFVVIEAVNGPLMLFGIKDWFGFAYEGINSQMGGIVTGKSLIELNALRGTKDTTFVTEMMLLNDKFMKYGFRMKEVLFVDFEGADDATKTLMASFQKPILAENDGKAAVITQTNASKVYEIKTNTEFAQDLKAITNEQKRLIAHGKIRVDAKGVVVAGVADPEVIAWAKAYTAMAKAVENNDTLKSLMIGGGVVPTLDVTKIPTK